MLFHQTIFIPLPFEAKNNPKTSVHVRVYKFLQSHNPMHTAVLNDCTLWFLLTVTILLRHNPPPNT